MLYVVTAYRWIVVQLEREEQLSWMLDECVYTEQEHAVSICFVHARGMFYSVSSLLPTTEATSYTAGQA